MINEKLLELLDKIKNKYLSKKNLFVLFSLKDEKSLKHLERLDCIQCIILNALRYEEYHRALIYLRFYVKICKKEFSDKKMNSYVEKLCKKYSLPM